MHFPFQCFSNSDLIHIIIESLYLHRIVGNQINEQVIGAFFREGDFYIIFKKQKPLQFHCFLPFFCPYRVPDIHLSARHPRKIRVEIDGLFHL